MTEGWSSFDDFIRLCPPGDRRAAVAITPAFVRKVASLLSFWRPSLRTAVTASVLWEPVQQSGVDCCTPCWRYGLWMHCPVKNSVAKPTPISTPTTIATIICQPLTIRHRRCQ